LSPAEGEASAAAQPAPQEQNKEDSKDVAEPQNAEQSEAQKDSAEDVEKPKEAEGPSEADEEVRGKESAEEKGRETTDKKEVKVEYLPLDLASFQSTKECVRLFKGG